MTNWKNKLHMRDYSSKLEDSLLPSIFLWFYNKQIKKALPTCETVSHCSDWIKSTSISRYLTKRSVLLSTELHRDLAWQSLVLVRIKWDHGQSDERFFTWEVGFTLHSVKLLKVGGTGPGSGRVRRFIFPPERSNSYSIRVSWVCKDLSVHYLQGLTFGTEVGWVGDRVLVSLLLFFLI